MRRCGAGRIGGRSDPRNVTEDASRAALADEDGSRRLETRLLPQRVSKRDERYEHDAKRHDHPVPPYDTQVLTQAVPLLGWRVHEGPSDLGRPGPAGLVDRFGFCRP